MSVSAPFRSDFSSLNESLTLTLTLTLILTLTFPHLHPVLDKIKSSSLNTQYKLIMKIQDGTSSAVDFELERRSVDFVGHHGLIDENGNGPPRL